MLDVVRGVLAAGGWAPLAIFGVHLYLELGIDAYTRWPWIDIPMHLLGGVAIAWFVWRGVRVRFPELMQARHGRVLSAVVVAGLTTTAAVLWEFGEFLQDVLLGTNVQGSVANTMQDLAMGMVGAALVMLAGAGRPTCG